MLGSGRSFIVNLKVVVLLYPETVHHHHNNKLTDNNDTSKVNQYLWHIFKMLKTKIAFEGKSPEFYQDEFNLDAGYRERNTDRHYIKLFTEQLTRTFKVLVLK